MSRCVTVTGVDNDTNCLFITFIYNNTLSGQWPIYPCLGAYSQITTLTVTLSEHWNYKTLYLICIPL